MKVHWTDTALEHLITIYDYVSQDSQIYANRLVEKLTRRSEQIGKYPKSGRAVPEYQRQDIREVIEKPYRIIYRIKTDRK